MRLTKEAQKVVDKLKAEGYTEDEINERFPVLPHEYESEEEKKEDEEVMRKIIAEQRAKRTPEEQKELDDFVKTLK